MVKGRKVAYTSIHREDSLHQSKRLAFGARCKLFESRLHTSHGFMCTPVNERMEKKTPKKSSRKRISLKM